MYLANRLHKELDIHFPSSLVGQEIPYKVLRTALAKILKPLDARIRVIQDEELRMKRGSKRQYCAVSGYFDTGKKKAATMIVLHVSPSKKTFKMTKSRYNNLRFIFSQIVQHEFIHKSQYMFRPEQSERLVKVYYSNKLSKERLKTIEYLSTWCEIEAYAHDIAMEINNYYSTLNPSSVIKHIDEYRNLHSYRIYRTTFEGTEWSRLKKSLLKKVWRWLPCAQPPIPI